MAFSMLDFVGSQISLRCAHNRGMAKFHFVNDGANQSSKLELPKNGPASGRLLFCKRECIDFEERTSANEVRKEIERCYELIQKLGRGVVYLGSSRMGPDHPHYVQAMELGREIASLLDCTSWTGAGPGLMDAVTKGALEAGKLVGGFKISREAGEWTATNFHPYLPSETYLTCRFFSARKHGLVDAAVRNTAADRTAVVALPGGIGTLDEMFEVLTLIQLERIGSKLPVPFLLMNYDSFYSKLLGFLDDCEDWGTVSKGEVASLWKVCNDNSEALEYLEKFYN
ncbi:probable cytokinin riboside 5'-monophosphate phosphoribohydrolase LOGL10 isoform X1 [Telopea speciosissima]|uniref:probable cytokinin riboside 5'-monophosphate phosphoribohydrolase LOGL10 isoform X1 n=1 Tax=Telopea speciosissima TaxID=54955 RepID=UPI001CC4C4BC|nr:probable cytokinin riboside 5'-monophosphate phosphoribohydrolase LOGL10 isoform X1 [Telopea speciosissima]